MSFSFDFLNENSDDNVTPADEKVIFGNSLVNNDPFNITREILIGESHLENVPFAILETEVGSFKRSLLHYQTGIDKDLDLISGKYEGGYKVWECSVDLLTYMLENKDSLPSVSTSKVIELGCGHGFPGIVALQLGYPHMVFSDLNAEVLIESTWPNIHLNCSSDAVLNAKCLSGDWLSLSDHLTSQPSTDTDRDGCISGQFELILSAETLYSTESCKKMFLMLDRHLSHNGIALLANKRFYFGVGGGTSEFQALVDKQSRQGEDVTRSEGEKRAPLTMEVVRVFADGSSNIREIILVRRRSCKQM